MQKPNKILEDKRPIVEIATFDTDIVVWAVGVGWVTAIVAYGEPGQGAYVPWFAVYQGDHIKTRIDASRVSVHYGDAPEE